MKQLLFLLALIVGPGYFTNAQTGDTTTDPGFTAAPAKQPVSPAVRAARQLTMMQKKLNLNQQQVIQVRSILLNRAVSLDSIRDNPSGDRRADNKARRGVNQDADIRIYALLTTDQQVIYTQWKQEQQTRQRLNRAARNGGVQDTTHSPQN